MNKLKRQTIFARFQAQNPKPTTELIYHSPFQLLVAVILSAQTTDNRVNIVTKPLFSIAPDPQSILALGQEKLSELIRSVNYYKTKAGNLIRLCQILLEEYAGKIPKERDQLEALPGVGRKTANVILNTLFDMPVIAVDTHILRVANRIGLANANTPKEVEYELMRTIPKQFLKDAHHWLILHGRYVCIARRPKCPWCIIRDLCEYKYKTL